MSIRTGRWRWSTIPVPEEHVAGLRAGTLVHLVFPRPLDLTASLRAARGGGALAAPALLAAWATLAAGRVEVEHPDLLVISGPYRPMRRRLEWPARRARSSERRRLAPSRYCAREKEAGSNSLLDMPR